MSGRGSRCLPLALLLVGACAHVEPPPGGPDDETAPRLAFSEPDSLSVVPSWTGPVVLRFDERISEQGVVDAVSVSPRTSAVEIDRGRDGIRVSMRGGWRPGTIYHVTVTRDVRDLFNNRLAEPVTLVFSTGPEIPATLVQGSVTDRITGRPSAGTRVEAVRRTDSLVYAVPTDSAGAFRIAHIPTGTYLLRAFNDANRNRALDGYEARDSSVVEIGTENPAAATLAIVDPDTTAPKLAGASARQGGGVELAFDDYLDPAQELPAGAVQIADSAGSAIRVAAVTLTPQAPEAGAAGDRPQPVPGATAPDAQAPGGSTTTTPLPAQTVYVQLAEATPLVAGRTYQVTVSGVRNVVGLVGGGTAELTAPTPPPAPPAAAPGVAAPPPGGPGAAGP